MSPSNPYVGILNPVIQNVTIIWRVGLEKCDHVKMRVKVGLVSNTTCLLIRKGKITRGTGTQRKMPREYTVKRHPSASQEEKTQKKPNLWTP